MAANTVPIFPLTAFASGDGAEVTAAITSLSAGTGATTIVTGDTDGSNVRGLQFAALSATPATLIAVCKYNGTARRIVDWISVPERGMGPDDPPWTFTWYAKDADGILKSGNRYDVGFFGATFTMHVTPFGGGDYS